MNNIKGFSTKSKKAGHKWAKYFVKRHPKILVKKAKNLSSACAMCANEINVKNWFKEYEKVLADLNITSPEQIWSGDETGVQNVPKEEYVLAQKWISANQIVSGEQGEMSTILTFVNGIGDVCPPMVIHKGQRVQQYWTEGSKPGVTLAATQKGYITKHKFHLYGIRFVKYLKAKGKLDRPHILLIDSHKSHVYNMPFFEEMKENNIHVMAIPPHTSHIVQALDSTPYAQFKKNWQTSLVDWNFYHSGKFLGKGDFFRVMWPAWTHAMTVANIQSGFRKTGIFPVNFEAIDKEKFTPSSVTDSKIL